MTRVVKIEETGGPEVLKFKSVKLDKPGPEEVLIEHKAIGLNFIDTYHRSGLYPLELPSGIGGEGSGIIKEIGSKVKDFSVGEHVAYAGAPLGSYSSERNYPTKNLVKIPDGIIFDVAATLMTKGLTTYYLLYKTYPVSANETILFHAAAGGVGQPGRTYSDHAYFRDRGDKFRGHMGWQGRRRTCKRARKLFCFGF